MANLSLNDPATEQKCFPSTELSLHDQLDQLQEDLQQVVALASVANSQDFLDFEEDVLHDYLWVLRNMAVSTLDRYNLLKVNLDKVISII